MNMSGPSALSELVVVVVGATDLAAVDKSGTSDPYAKVIVRSGGKALEKKTKEVRKNLNPQWNERFAFPGVDDASTEIVVQIKDWNAPSASNLLGQSKALGQVSFRLSGMALPADGGLIEREMGLSEEVEGRKSRASVQGSIRLRIGWRQPLPSESDLVAPSLLPALAEDAPRSRPTSYSETPQLMGGVLLGGEEPATADPGGSGAPNTALGSPPGASTGVAAATSAAPAASGEGGAVAAAEAPFERPDRPGQLRVVLLQANGLAAADKRGTSDPYAKLIVRAGGKEHKGKSKVVKRTCDPVWNETFTFNDVADVGAELCISLYDDDGRLASSDPLGQVDFILRDLTLPPDGAWLRLPPAAVTATKGSASSKIEAQGTVEILIGWLRPTATPAEAGSALPGGGGEGEGAAAPDAPFERPDRPGRLCVALLQARGLAAADKRGTSDPYAKLVVRTGEKEHKGKSKVVKRTCDPVWNELFTFDGVPDAEAEVVIVLKDDDGLVGVAR